MTDLPAGMSQEIAAVAEACGLDDKIEEARAGAKTFGGKSEIVLQMLLPRAYNKNLGGDRRLDEPRV